MTFFMKATIDYSSRSRGEFHPKSARRGPGPARPRNKLSCSGLATSGRPHLLVGTRTFATLGTGISTGSDTGLALLRGAVVDMYGDGKVGTATLACGLSTDGGHVLSISHSTLLHVFAYTCTCQVANSTGCLAGTRASVGTIYGFPS